MQGLVLLQSLTILLVWLRRVVEWCEESFVTNFSSARHVLPETTCPFKAKQNDEKINRNTPMRKLKKCRSGNDERAVSFTGSSCWLPKNKLGVFCGPGRVTTCSGMQ
jgi:hypothetical protein